MPTACRTAPPKSCIDGFSYTGGNMHTSANGLEFGIDGWIYGRTGHAHVQSIGPPGTPTSQRTRLHGSIFRFHPVTKAFEALSSGTVNPWGQDWDKHGEHFFDSTIVGHFWYQMPGAKFVSSSAEPNLKAYELIDHIADHRFGGGSSAGTIIGAGGGGRGGGGRGGGAVRRRRRAGRRAGRGAPPVRRRGRGAARRRRSRRGAGAGAAAPAASAARRGATGRRRTRRRAVVASRPVDQRPLGRRHDDLSGRQLAAPSTATASTC